MSNSNGVGGGKGGGAPAAAAAAPAPAPAAPTTAAQSRRAMLEEYRRQKQLQKQQQQQPKPAAPAAAASASATGTRTAQGLRSKIQGLKSPPPAKRTTVSASSTAATKRGTGAAASSSSSSAARKPMVAVDNKKIQQAGERAVAPGTPVHSLQKRLRLRSPLAGGGQQEQEEDAGKGASGSGKYVPVESKVAAIFKKPAPVAASSFASPAKPQTEQEAEVAPAASPAPQAEAQKGGKTLTALVEEATALARWGFLPAARALLETAGEEHRCRALYWAGRARVEEEQEGRDWDRAADLLEEGLICVARDEAEAAMLRATRKEFLDRRTRAALASVETLLEAEDDELPAPAPTPVKKGAKGKAGAGDSEEEEDDDDSDEEDAVPRMSLTPARAAAHHQRQQQQGQQQRPPASQPKPTAAAARLSTPSAASVPSLRLPAVAPTGAAASAASDDKENAPVQQEAARRSSGLSSLSSSDTLPKPALPIAVAGVAASPSTPGRKALVRTSLGSPQRSPSPAKPPAPFQSPLAGGAVRVPTGSTGRSLLGKGAVRRPSLLMSPTNILRSGGPQRVTTPQQPPPTAHADADDDDDDEEEEEAAEGAYTSPALKLFYGAGAYASPTPSARVGSPSMPGDYGYDYEGNEEAEGEEGCYYDEGQGEDDWAADGANEWSDEALAAMGGDDGMDMLGDDDGGYEGPEEEADLGAVDKAAMARMLMPPPPSSAGKRLSGARRSSLSTGAARVLLSKDNDLQQQGQKQQQLFACPPMEMDAASGERKRTPVVSRYPRTAKVYTDSLEGLSPGGATLLAAVPRTNPDGTRVYTPVRRSTRLLSAAIGSSSSGKKGQSHGKAAQATPSPLRRDMERLLADMHPLSLQDE